MRTNGIATYSLYSQSNENPPVTVQEALCVAHCVPLLPMYLVPLLPMYLGAVSIGMCVYDRSVCRA